VVDWSAEWRVLLLALLMLPLSVALLLLLLLSWVANCLDLTKGDEKAFWVMGLWGTEMVEKDWTVPKGAKQLHASAVVHKFPFILMVVSD